MISERKKKPTAGRKERIDNTGTYKTRQSAETLIFPLWSFWTGVSTDLGSACFGFEQILHQYTDENELIPDQHPELRPN